MRTRISVLLLSRIFLKIVISALFSHNSTVIHAFVRPFQRVIVKSTPPPSSTLSQTKYGLRMSTAGYDQEDYLTKRATFEPTQSTQDSHTATPWPAYYCNPDLKRTLNADLWKDSESNNAEMTLNELLQSSRSRFVPVWKGHNLISTLNRRNEDKNNDMEDENNLISPTAPLSSQATLQTEAIFLKYDANLIEPLLSHPDSILCHLGQMNDLYYFGLDISYFQVEPIRLFQKNYEGISFQQLRSIGGTLTEDYDASILATARGYGVWHRSMLYCSKCGSRTESSLSNTDTSVINDSSDVSSTEEESTIAPMIPQKIGTGRKCSNPSCNASYYPRIDPSMIAMIFSNPSRDYVLLGRKSVWPSGRYSVLAGFAEIGESMEECVVREVFEESGVVLERHSLQFFASQPWPFPRSLMVGFTGIASTLGVKTDGELPKITVDEMEMEDIQWFSKEEVRFALEGKKRENIQPDADTEQHLITNLSIPGRASLAYKMLSSWVQEN